MKFLLLLIAVPQVYAATLYPREGHRNKELAEVITNSIFEELIEYTKDIKVPLKQVETKKTSPNRGSRGKQIIEEMKRRNREKLAKKRGINPDQVKSGADLVKAQKADNKQLIKDIQTRIKQESQFKELAESEIKALREQVKQDWKEKHRARIAAWEAKRRTFQKEKGKYQDTTFKLPLVLPVPKKDREKEVAVKVARDFYIVPGAMNVPIRDQKFRPTCSAFAGVKLAEVLLAQHGSVVDLSEQYFYWASKDTCQDRPCSKKGSWVGNGFKYSRLQSGPDIPLEDNCPYENYSKPGNETQVPLKKKCEQGHVKVGDFQYLNTLDQVVKALNSKRSVIASMKLTPNFYSAKSVILYKNKDKGDTMDDHAQGHSMVIVGYVKLPSVLNEGKLCFIVANSWGEGWGEGGYSCLSEKWILNQRQVNPFVSLSYLRR